MGLVGLADWIERVAVLGKEFESRSRTKFAAPYEPKKFDFVLAPKELTEEEGKNLVFVSRMK